MSWPLDLCLFRKININTQNKKIQTFFLRLRRGFEDTLISFSLICSSKGTRIACKAKVISSLNKKNNKWEEKGKHRK